MIALLDADQICYSVGFKAEDVDDLSEVKYRVDKYIDTRLLCLGTRDCELYLTDSKHNFRLAIYPQYKANRENLVKPKWYKAIRQHMIDGWDAEVIEYLEADDCVAIRQNMLGSDAVLVSDDKDLDQVVGHHMKMTTFEQYEIHPEQAIRNLYCQLLTGDRIDNIPGIFRVGPARATKMLSQCGFEPEHLYRMCEWKRAEASPTLYDSTKRDLTCLRMIQTVAEYEIVHQAMKNKSYMNILDIV